MTKTLCPSNNLYHGKLFDSSDNIDKDISLVQYLITAFEGGFLW